MPDLLIPNVSEATMRSLQAEAKATGRSVNEVAIDRITLRCDGEMPLPGQSFGDSMLEWWAEFPDELGGVAIERLPVLLPREMREGKSGVADVTDVDAEAG